MSNSEPVTVREVIAVRWRIARLVPEAGTAVVLTTGLCNLLLGLLPVAFVVGTSVMLGRVPEAMASNTGYPEWSAVVTAFVLSSAAFAAQQVLTPVQTALGELVARRVDGKIFDRLIVASLRSPGIGPLEDQRLLDALTEASKELQDGFQSPGKACAGLLNLIARVVQLAGYVVVVGVAFSWLAAAGLLAAVLTFRHGNRGGLRRYSRLFPQLSRLRRESWYLRGLAMRATAAKEIRIFGLVSWLTDRYRRTYLSWLRPVWRERRRIYLWPYFWYTAFGLVITAAVFATVGAAGAGSAALTNLALVVQAVLGALRLGDFYPEADVQTQFGMNAYEAVRTFERGMNTTAPHPGPRAAATAAPVPRDAICFDTVRFRYPGQDRPVFDGLQLRIPAGACTAVVGVNGAGKTTLVKLLTRLHEPEAGTVNVDDVDICHYDLASWRSRIAVVFQDFNRYEVSAAENIGYGAVEHLDDREQIRAAAADTGILDVLDSLPSGLDTPLARHVTGGAELSGGQWQRVALARALFRLRQDGALLVLDEPTASLDARAEARFFDEFIRLTRGATTILISHRFSTVRHADHIVVLEEGQVAEEGSHADLLRLDGRYAHLFRLQAERFGDADPPLLHDVTDEAEAAA
ncbi:MULTISPECIES: ABC transporter ATP-binding protein [unclassified Micromonospora]|uniref:ABC transporter ATP-binding protein n=1 Tax=unclassified Micromonospora TaxID=2617518 RepID=UPI003A8B2052